MSVAVLRVMCLNEKVKHTRMRNGPSGRTTYLIFRESLEAILKPYEPPVLKERPKKQLHLRDARRKPGRPLKCIV